jgi:transposase
VPADWSEQQGARTLLARLLEHLPRLLKIWADQGYRGDLVAWLSQEYGVELEIVSRLPDHAGFVVLARRWVVERTFGWLCRNRRLSREYEHLPASSTAMLYLAAAHLLLKRLAPVNVAT